MGAVHGSAGRDGLALQLYEDAGAAATKLPESHAAIALLHSCAGVALCHAGHHVGAYERLVKAMVGAATKAPAVLGADEQRAPPPPAALVITPGGVTARAAGAWQIGEQPGLRRDQAGPVAGLAD
jgi:hypothetical protein